MRLRNALLAGLLLAGTGGIATAQPATHFDPTALPAIHGTVAEYSLTPRGDVDGLILQDGTLVHLPPRLGAALVYIVRPGATVTVHGLKALGVPVVQAMSVTNDATGKTLVDAGGPPGGPEPGGPPPPGGPHGPHRPPMEGQVLTAQGTVKMALYGPRGDLNGVLLTDGTQIHLPPPEAARLSSWLKPGQQIYAEGHGMDNPLGRVLAAERIGPNQAEAITISPPPRPPRGTRPPPPEAAPVSPPAPSSGQ